MATPYSAVSGGSKDAYNFYHSQLRVLLVCWHTSGQSFGVPSQCKFPSRKQLLLWLHCSSCITFASQKMIPFHLFVLLMSSGLRCEEACPLLRHKHPTVMEVKCSFHTNSWMADSILMTLIKVTVATKYVNISPKQIRYIDSCLVIVYMTLLLEQTWCVQPPGVVTLPGSNTTVSYKFTRRA